MNHLLADDSHEISISSSIFYSNIKYLKMPSYASIGCVLRVNSANTRQSNVIIISCISVMEVIDGDRMGCRIHVVQITFNTKRCLVCL